ncbi:MAG: DUF6049 family protein [Microbacterium sp.]|uniref:DUF6049 family protein n=1 Tax=Microbacterium sp. TaxID=51671 RepID=UPI0039E718A4
MRGPRRPARPENMTVPFAHAGMTATRRRRAVLVGMLIAMLVLVVGALPAAAATPTPTPTASGELTATLAALGDGEVAAGDTLPATLAVDNGTADAVSAGTVTLMLADQALAGRADLASWLDGGDAPAGTAVATAELGTIAGGASAAASFLVAGDAEALTSRAAGVYPLWVTIDTVTARSVIVVPSGESATVGVVVPITAGALSTGLLTTDELSTLTAEDGALTQQLDAVTGTSAILAVDPAIPASIRVLGTAAPTTAQDWLTRLEELPNTRFALQFGDADVSTQLAAGLTSPLQPTSLVSYIDETDFPAEPEPTPSATATTGTESTVPDLTTLLGIGASTADAYWPPTGTTSTSIVDTLAAATPGAVTLVASTATTAGAGGATVAASGRTDAGSGILVYDAAVSTALGTAANMTDATARSAALATASAYLAFASADAAGTPLLVAVDRSASVSETSLRAAITAVTDATGVTAAGLDALTAAAQSTLSLVDETVDQTRTDALAALESGADSIARFATILDDPALLTAAEDAEILQLLGAAWLTRSADWQQALTDHAAQTADTLASVSIVPPTSINLLTAGTNLKFWIHNALPYAVHVTLFASPDDLRLTVDHQTDVTAAAASADAASNTPVEVPVRARIANGEVSITLTLRSPTMEPIGGPQVVDVNVRADWENVGVAILVVLVGAFLTIGIIRTVRRRRRAAARKADA